ncbi:MAG TPA: inositol monophosphatase family protein [Patescibacteria group bacterium]|nr:inositol monophosphatase family protein [Patescibacteria group bacterium]
MLDVAIKAAKEAGALIKKAYYDRTTAGSTFKKENQTLQVVTDADVAAEKIILEILKEQFPKHSFFSEEVGEGTTTNDYRWIIDPIDGTSNFARKIPFFCVSIGLTYKNEPILGVVYQPITDELFVAEKGRGSFLNGEKITIAQASEMSKTFITVDRGKSKEEKERFTSIVSELNRHVRSMRMPGSSALQTCYVSCGKFDAAIFNGLSFYDIAASSVIAREAGAQLSNFAAKDWQLKTGDILICNPALQQEFSNILSGL